MIFLKQFGSPIFWIFVLSITFVATAEEGKSGLSANRLKLPKGPGSIEGVGEDATVQPNMGITNYSVPISLPSGFNGFSPSLSLSYSSSGGMSEVGMGWQINFPKIERMTSRGLPQYNREDFISAQGEELVFALEEDGHWVYRARFENSFSRYHWLDEDGNGRRGYWMVETPDGRLNFYGANANGEIVANARIENERGTYCYMLVEQQDALGHRILYEYNKEPDEKRPYLTKINWAFENEPSDEIGNLGESTYEVQFEYVRRPDFLMDGKSGELITLKQRLIDIKSLVRQEQQKRFHLEYEAASISSGLSRLRSVTQYGLEDEGPYPISFSFRYSEALSQLNVSRVSLGSIGVDLRDGKADFNDLNSDGLPDIIHTPDDGQHQIFFQTPRKVGNEVSLVFENFIPSEVSGNGGLLLSSPTVHMSDIDGNGKSDMLDTGQGTILWNSGNSDWESLEEVGEGVIPEFAENTNRRFLDVNYDRLIDIIQIEDGAGWFYKNLGEGRFDVAVDLQNSPGGSFTENGYQFGDMNGDGMVDLVQPLRAGFVVYWPNLGFGTFGEAIEMFFEDNPEFPLEAADLGILEQNIQYSDLNGDGLDDALSVQDGEILYALNKSGFGFRGWERIRTTQDGEGLPLRDDSVSIRLADMNGSGTTDIVYIDASGHVEYVELYSSKPHLLTHIENGIGKNMDIQYESTVEQWLRLRDEERANHDVPHPMIVVKEISISEPISGIQDTRKFFFKHGFYDGVEHQFRGFEQVEVITEGDEYTEDGLTTYRFDVGKEDVYRKGLELEIEQFSEQKALTSTTHQYGDCEVWTKEQLPLSDEVRSGPFAVRSICKLETHTLIKEGQPENEWVETRSRQAFDGYGNVIEKVDWGVVSIGDQVCVPCEAGRDPLLEQGIACGPKCRGDEKTEIYHFITPGLNTEGRWFTQLMDQKRIKGHPESPIHSLEHLFYDGEAFIGLELGQATQGIVKRKSAQVDDDGRMIDVERLAYDAHGNVVGMKDANDNHRTLVIDENGLWIRAEIVHLDDYDLRLSIPEYHPILEKPLQSTTWNRVENGMVQDELRITSYQYDSFGRLVAVAKPDDPGGEPSQTYLYDLGTPMNRIVTRQRVSHEHAESALESIQCFDGRGRSLQTKVKLEEGQYQSQGFSVFGKNGKVVKAYQPHISLMSDCELNSPNEILFSEQTYDASGRSLEVHYPDQNIFGTKSVMRKVYGPLWSQAWDPEDTDPNSEIHFETPMTTYSNGIGQVTQMTFLESRNAPPLTIEVRHDAFGRLSSLRSPEGHIKTQRYDLLGRIIETTDPDRGRITFEHDDVGNVLSRTDARDISTNYSYDRANRITAQWNPLLTAETMVTWQYDRLDLNPGFDDTNEETCGDEPCTFQAGQLSQISYPLLEGEDMALERFSYDQRARLKTRAFLRNGQTFLSKAFYDAADRTVLEEFPAQIHFEYGYDGASRLTNVSGIVDNLTYDEKNLVNSIHHQNGVTTFFTHDERLLLSNISTLSPQNRAFMDLDYRRNRKGHILQIEDASDLNVGPLPVYTENAIYQYDALDRLVGANLEMGSDRNEILGFQFSADGNLLQKQSSFERRSNAHVGELRYHELNQPHAVIQAGDSYFEYDEAGNLLEQDGSPEGRLAHRWNHLGQLVETTKNNNSVARYAYNHDGERAIKWEEGKRVEYLSPQIEIRNGIVSVFVKSGGKIIAKVQSKELANELLPDLAPLLGSQPGTIEIYPNEQINSSDAWVLFTQEQNEFNFEQLEEPNNNFQKASVSSLLEAAVSSLLFENGESLITHYHHNHLGSTALLTDENAEQLSRTYYYPYGEIRSKEGGLPDYNFTGKERDQKTGLSYHSARYLNPLPASWISADPHYATLGKPTLKSPWEAINPFGYTVGNPINLHDPTGKWSSKDIPPLFDHIHQEAIERSLNAEAAYHYIRTMQKAQHDIDKSELQTNADQFRHAMRGKGQSKEQAIQQANTFIRSRLSEAVAQWKDGNRNTAYYHVGLAIHTVQDASSPEHRGFQEWDEDAGNTDLLNHAFGENLYPGGKEKALLEGGTRWIHDLFRKGINDGCNSQNCFDNIDFFDSKTGEALIPSGYLDNNQSVDPSPQQTE